MKTITGIKLKIVEIKPLIQQIIILKIIFKAVMMQCLNYFEKFRKNVNEVR